MHKFHSDLNLCLKSITGTENTIYNTDMLLKMLELSSNRRSNWQYNCEDKVIWYINFTFDNIHNFNLEVYRSYPSTYFCIDRNLLYMAYICYHLQMLFWMYTEVIVQQISVSTNTFGIHRKFVSWKFGRMDILLLPVRRSGCYMCVTLEIRD